MAFSLPESPAGRAPQECARHSDRALRLVAFRVFRRVRQGAHPKSARGIRPSPLEGAFSGV